MVGSRKVGFKRNGLYKQEPEASRINITLSSSYDNNTALHACTKVSFNYLRFGDQGCN